MEPAHDISPELVCPNCTESEMVLDEMFPDNVVWVCFKCRHRCTPKTYVDEWEKWREITVIDHKSRLCRIILYGLIQLGALAGLAYIFTR